MSAHRKKSKKARGDAPTPVVNSLPTLPSLYAESSEVTPHFRDKVETLTDSDDETKSTTSESEHSVKNEADENPWGFNDSDTESLNLQPQKPVIDCNPKKNKKRKTVELDEDDFRPQKKKKKEKDKDEVPTAVISTKAQKMMGT